MRTPIITLLLLSALLLGVAPAAEAAPPVPPLVDVCADALETCEGAACVTFSRQVPTCVEEPRSSYCAIGTKNPCAAGDLVCVGSTCVRDPCYTTHCTGSSSLPTEEERTPYCAIGTKTPCRAGILACVGSTCVWDPCYTTHCFGADVETPEPGVDVTAPQQAGCVRLYHEASAGPAHVIIRDSCTYEVYVDGAPLLA